MHRAAGAPSWAASHGLLLLDLTPLVVRFLLPHFTKISSFTLVSILSCLSCCLWKLRKHSRRTLVLTENNHSKAPTLVTGRQDPVLSGRGNSEPPTCVRKLARTGLKVSRALASSAWQSGYCDFTSVLRSNSCPDPHKRPQRQPRSQSTGAGQTEAREPGSALPTGHVFSLFFCTFQHYKTPGHQLNHKVLCWTFTRDFDIF